MPPFKRKAVIAAVPNGQPDTKRLKQEHPDFSDRTRYKDSSIEIEHGIVQRQFYPPEMTNERVRQYVSGNIERPIDTLRKAVADTAAARSKINVKECVIHWYKNDLRIKDNRSLSFASKKARNANDGRGVPLICIYLVSPQDFKAHLTAPVRVDFILRNLKVLQEELSQLDIPLYAETIEKRKTLPKRILELCQEWRAGHIFCNEEYEVDELRREASLTRSCLENNISFNVVHDTCVVEPGKITTGAGGQMSVYSPWHRKWCAYLNQNPEELEESQLPVKNPSDTRSLFMSLFDCKIPEAPEGKKITDEERQRFAGLWPAGEEEAHERLQKFLSQRVARYHDTRNLPAGNGTSVLSPHLASGTLSARTIIREARNAAPSRKLTDDRKQGHSMFIGEVAWRDFYKHVLCHWPFVCMNKCFKPECTDIEWEYNIEQFKRWSEGKTGYPLVDAAMRQLLHSGYMHNRCRMVVASFLAKHLMIDWRMGEQFFMEHLIDGDFASNSGGWGFSASCGVDPQPYFRIFNPLLQSEKFDPSGDYIRKWVPELRDVNGKAIHEPYERGADIIAKKNGYPRPVVEHRFARNRALERYKAGMGKSSA